MMSECTGFMTIKVENVCASDWDLAVLAVCLLGVLYFSFRRYSHHTQPFIVQPQSDSDEPTGPDADPKAQPIQEIPTQFTTTANRHFWGKIIYSFCLVVGVCVLAFQPNWFTPIFENYIGDDLLPESFKSRVIFVSLAMCGVFAIIPQLGDAQKGIIAFLHQQTDAPTYALALKRKWARRGLSEELMSEEDKQAELDVLIADKHRDTIETWLMTGELETYWQQSVVLFSNIQHNNDGIPRKFENTLAQEFCGIQRLINETRKEIRAYKREEAKLLDSIIGRQGVEAFKGTVVGFIAHHQKNLRISGVPLSKKREELAYLAKVVWHRVCFLACLAALATGSNRDSVLHVLHKFGFDTKVSAKPTFPLKPIGLAALAAVVLAFILSGAYNLLILWFEPTVAIGEETSKLKPLVPESWSKIILWETITVLLNLVAIFCAVYGYRWQFQRQKQRDLTDEERENQCVGAQVSTGIWVFILLQLIWIPIGSSDQLAKDCTLITGSTGAWSCYFFPWGLSTALTAAICIGFIFRAAHNEAPQHGLIARWVLIQMFVAFMIATAYVGGIQLQSTSILALPSAFWYFTAFVTLSSGITTAVLGTIVWYFYHQHFHPAANTSPTSDEPPEDTDGSHSDSETGPEEAVSKA